MKKMTKIKLINWMYFQNITINVDGNTLITGINASGKSTIIDAIQYLLVGGKRGLKLNNAADQSGQRTVEGYVRGNVGISGQEYLRSGDVISHIAIEVTGEKSTNILGVVMEYPSVGEMKSRFYTIADTNMRDDLFITRDNYPRDFQSIFQFVKGTGREIKVLDGSKHRAAIESIFGLDANNYLKLLPRAIGFKSVSKIDELINNFLFEEDNVDVSSLKNNIREFDATKENIKVVNEKIAKLRDIESIYEEQKKLFDSLRIMELVSVKSDYEYEFFRKKAEEDELTSLRNNLKVANDNAEKQTKDYENKKADYEQLLKSLKTNDIHELYISSKESLEREKEKLGTLKLEFEELQNILKKEETIISSLLSNESNSILDKCIEVIRKNKYKTIDLQECLSDIYEEISKIKFKAMTEMTGLQASMDSFEAEENGLTRKIRDLENNIKPYQDYITTLISELNDRLSREYGKTVIVKPVCEFVKEVDSEWRNALEGYLSSQRFDIICESPNHFKEAVRIYEKIKKEKRIHNVGIIDLEKYLVEVMPQEGSLSERIVLNNRFARNYIYTLLNRVKCVENIDDLSEKKGITAITKTVMIYSNNVVRNTNPKVYETPFLGLEANKISVKNFKEKLAEVIKDKGCILEKIKKAKSVIDDCNSSNSFLLINNKKSECIDLLIESNRKVIILGNTIKEYEKNPTIIELSGKLISFEKAMNESDNLRKKALEKHAQIVDSIKSKREYLTTLSEIVEFKETSLKELMKTHGAYDALAKDRLVSLSRGLSKIKTDEVIRKEITKLSNSYTTKNLDLVEKMVFYNHEYSFSSKPNYDNFTFYRDELQKCIQNDLAEYTDELDELKLKMSNLFKIDFVDGLQTKINDAKDQVYLINESLKDKHFGEQRYKITCTKASDIKFAKYYEAILEGSAAVKEIFSEEKSSKSQSLINDLFDQIINYDVDTDAKAREFLDYRKYLDFDIDIIDKDGRVKKLSSVKGTQSGGEGQVPLYIVAAVSFQQLLNKNRNSEDNLCIVLFDEAFNNMDSFNVDSMMKFYKNLNIQVFLSLTSEKIENIAKYVDTVLGVIREGETAEVNRITWEAEID